MYSTQCNPHLWSKITDWMSDRQARRSWRTASRPLSLLRDPLVMPHRWAVFGGQGGWRITRARDNLDFWDLEMQELQQIRSRFEFRIFCCFILKIYLGTYPHPACLKMIFRTSCLVRGESYFEGVSYQPLCPHTNRSILDVWKSEASISVLEKFEVI